MKAYVSIRGSRSLRRVDRDASPAPIFTAHGTARHEPYAALCFPDGRGDVFRFELAYSVSHDGEITVWLRDERPGTKREEDVVARFKA